MLNLYEFLTICLLCFIVLSIWTVIITVSKPTFKNNITWVVIIIALILLQVTNYFLSIRGLTPPMSILRDGYNAVLRADKETPRQPINTYQVRDFTPAKYDLGIENFGQIGNCKGIVFYIKKRYQLKNPAKIALSDKDKSKLYRLRTSAFLIDDVYNKKNTPLNFTWDEIIANRYDGIPIYTLDQKDIIGHISDLQQKSHLKYKVFFNLTSEASGPFSLFWLCMQTPEKIKGEIDIDGMINRIRQNELVVLGISNNHFGGHALLCYKIIEYNNMWHLYVLDPNIVYSRYPEHHPEEQTYITVGYIDGKQYYSYNPCLNGGYIYQNRYNSFVPGAAFLWD